MTKLTFTRTENTLRVEADGCTLVLKTDYRGVVWSGYVMAYGYGTRDMYSCWADHPHGVTAKEGKALLRSLFRTLRTMPYVQKAWAKAQAA